MSSFGFTFALLAYFYFGFGAGMLTILSRSAPQYRFFVVMYVFSAACIALLLVDSRQ